MACLFPIHFCELHCTLSNLFVYMIIMEGDDGYSTINSRLRSLPTGRSLPYEVIDENTMLSLWDNCPIT